MISREPMRKSVRVGLGDCMLRASVAHEDVRHNEPGVMNVVDCAGVDGEW